MFTKGRIIFIIVFVLLFVIFLIWSYRKDIKEHASVFKGSKRVLVIVLTFFIAFIALIRLMRYI